MAEVCFHTHHLLSSPWIPGGSYEVHLRFTDKESEGQGGDGPTGEQKRDVGPGLPKPGL